MVAPLTRSPPLRPARRAAIALTAATLAAGGLAACGGGGDRDGGRRAGTTSRREAVPAPADRVQPAGAAATSVIRMWSAALAQGEIDAATAYFAVPSIVQNGTPPLRLATRSAARVFNLTLPCGAQVLRTVRAGRYTVAEFRLIERKGPGAGCGSGSGGRAGTAFVIRDGRIREWRRIATVPRVGDAIPEGGVVPDDGAPPREQPRPSPARPADPDAPVV